MSKSKVTAAQMVHIGMGLKAAAEEAGLKLYDFADGWPIAPNPFMKILNKEQKEIEVRAYTFILEPLDE